MLSVKGLDYSYGSKDVLKDISFDAAPNKVISILGPNGVGKTTLMKCMCGIHRPDRGSIEVDGTPIDGFQPKELAQHVAYVPQHPLTSRTTVFDTILLGRNPYTEWSVTKTDTDMVWETI
ncbi:MAG: ABC transporter ATP-binding protein, partial [Candidatus Methanomethylophilaceae archaeon]